MPTDLVDRRIFAEGPDVDAIRTFLLDAWRGRAHDMRLDEPEDLSSSCKFGALFVQGLFGGQVRGNWHHVHCRLPDGRILDPSRHARDVALIRRAGSDPYRHDRSFVRSRDFSDSLESCRPRVDAWLREWTMDEHVPMRKRA